MLRSISAKDRVSARTELESKVYAFLKGLEDKVVSGNSVNVDESLILKRAVHQQDREAVAVLHAKYYLQVKRYIASCIGSFADAEDLAQDVFVELCRSNGQYDGRGNVEGYLFGMARNTIRRYHRERTNSVETIPIDSISDVAADYDIRRRGESPGQISEQGFERAIEDVTAKLSPKARQALKLRFIDGLGTKEAAKKAGCCIDTFYKRLQRAAKTLQDIRSRRRQLKMDNERCPSHS